MAENTPQVAICQGLPTIALPVPGAPTLSLGRRMSAENSRFHGRSGGNRRRTENRALADRRPLLADHAIRDEDPTGADGRFWRAHGHGLQERQAHAHADTTEEGSSGKWFGHLNGNGQLLRILTFITGESKVVFRATTPFRGSESHFSQRTSSSTSRTRSTTPRTRPSTTRTTPSMTRTSSSAIANISIVYADKAIGDSDISIAYGERFLNDADIIIAYADEVVGPFRLADLMQNRGFAEKKEDLRCQPAKSPIKVMILPQ